MDCVRQVAQTQAGLIPSSKAHAALSVLHIHFFVRIQLRPTSRCAGTSLLQTATIIPSSGLLFQATLIIIYLVENVSSSCRQCQMVPNIKLDKPATPHPSSSRLWIAVPVMQTPSGAVALGQITVRKSTSLTAVPYRYVSRSREQISYSIQLVPNHCFTLRETMRTPKKFPNKEILIRELHNRKTASILISLTSPWAASKAAVLSPQA